MSVYVDARMGKRSKESAREYFAEAGCDLVVAGAKFFGGKPAARVARAACSGWKVGGR